jgi:hypothetical protein
MASQSKGTTMWVFTKFGFFSIVQDRDLAEVVIVRARVRGDLETLWPKAKALIEETPEADYRYRTRMHREIAIAGIVAAMRDIDYGSFKAAVGDHRREMFYLQVWWIMSEMQDHLNPSASVD